MRMHPVIGAAAAFLAASCAGADAANDGDIALFGRDPGNKTAFACYTRHYDPAHLAGHPKQNVVDMTLFVNSYVDGERQYLLSIGVRFRAAPNLFEVEGGCNKSADGKNTLGCGIDCDGGHIDIRVKDANAILVSIPDGAATWDPESENEPPEDARFGLDDKLFRLDRTTLTDCLPIIYDEEAKAAILSGE
jgi:hypothetical protein